MKAKKSEITIGLEGSSLAKSDCIFLLKDVSEFVNIASLEQRSLYLKQGRKTYEFISEEMPVSEYENKFFEEIVEKEKDNIGKYIGILSEIIYAKKQDELVLVSLVRGGIPYGVLCKKYLKKIYDVDIPHYAISLIRDVGIDTNALKAIFEIHPSAKIQFVDGWTGSGLISRQLKEYIKKWNYENENKIDDTLAVLADTSKICTVAGTQEDILIPSGCLNATVSGLISSIFYDEKILTANDFHGTIVWGKLKDYDYTNYYINKISSSFVKQQPVLQKTLSRYVDDVSKYIETKHNVKKHQVRLGINESTRAIFRGKLKYLLCSDYEDERLRFIVALARKMNVRILKENTFDYRCIAILQES